MKYKIGQKISFSHSFKVEKNKGEVVKVVKGDEAMVVKKIDENNGEIVYVTGEAAGLSQIISIEVDDSVDVDYLAKKIMEDM